MAPRGHASLSIAFTPTQLSEVDAAGTMTHSMREEPEAQSRNQLPQVHQTEPWVSDALDQFMALHDPTHSLRVQRRYSCPGEDHWTPHSHGTQPLSLRLMGHWEEMPPCPPSTHLHVTFNLKVLHPDKSAAKWLLRALSYCS